MTTKKRDTTDGKHIEDVSDLGESDLSAGPASYGMTR